MDTGPLLEDGMPSVSPWRRVMRVVTCIGIFTGVIGVIAIIALFFALWTRRSSTTVLLDGDAQGPSDANVLRTVNPLDNITCVETPGTVQQCAWVDGAGRCHNPYCLPLNETLEFEPVEGPTINGTYPNISLTPIGPDGACDRCSLSLNIYGQVTAYSNGSVPSFSPFNCTGGAVLCQAGRDNEGNVVLIQDGPTCLTNGTVFAGDVGGIWSNLTLGLTGVVPGCYGNTTNNSINIPQICVSADGRSTSVTVQTFAFLLTNGTFGLLDTPNETTVTDLGGNVFQLGTIQPNDKEADLQFKRILLSPHTLQTVNTVNSTYTLALLGTTGTSSTPLLGVYDTANVDLVPELQLGLWTDGDRHPFISFNTFWNPVSATWVASKPNTTGFVIFDPYAGGTLYFSATGNSSQGNTSTTLELDIARMERSLFTSFVPLRVGVDPPSPVVGGVNGLQIIYEGNSAEDVPRLSMYMTYNGDTRPTFQLANLDIGESFLLFDGYLGTSGGFIHASTATIPVGAFYYRPEGAFHFAIVQSPGVDAPVSVANETLVISETSVDVYRPLFIGRSEATPRSIGLTVTGTTDAAIGLGMYQESASSWRFGNSATAAYAIHRANDKLSFLRAGTAAVGASVTPSPLMFVSPNETAIYSRTSLYNTNADLWGFQGNTTTPQWQIYSNGPGQQNILFDAWANPNAGGLLSYSNTTYDGARIAKLNNTIVIQGLFGYDGVTGGFNSYQTYVLFHYYGTNWYTENTEYGLAGLQVRALFGGLVTQHFGGYFDLTGIVRSGVSSATTYQFAYGGGQWVLNRCNPATLGAPIFTCAAALTITSTSTTVTGTMTVSGATTLQSTLAVTGATTLSSTLAVTGGTTLSSTLNVAGATTLQSTLAVTGGTTLSSTLTVTGATTLQSTLAVTGGTTLGSTLSVTGATILQSTLAVTSTSVLTGTVTLGGSPQLSGALAVNSGGTGVTNTLVGNRVMVSVAGGGPDGNGRIIESAIATSSIVEPLSTTVTGIQIRYMGLTGSGCPGDPTITNSASAKYFRFGNQVTIYAYTGFAFLLPGTCTAQFIQVQLSPGVDYPPPLNVVCIGSSATGGTARNSLMCLQPSGVITLHLSNADIPGGWPAGTTWTLPDTSVFTYLT